MTPTDYGLEYGQYFYDFNSDMTKIHAKGTIVKLSKEFINKRKNYFGEDIYDYAMFSHIYNADNEFSYVFYTCTNPDTKLFFYNNKDDVNRFYNSEWYFKIPPSDLDMAIEDYVYDISYEVDRPTYLCMKKDWEIPGMTRAWGILIIIMIASMVFKGFPILWFIEIAIFNSWRSDFINK